MHIRRSQPFPPAARHQPVTGGAPRGEEVEPPSPEMMVGHPDEPRINRKRKAEASKAADCKVAVASSKRMGLMEDDKRRSSPAIVDDDRPDVLRLNLFIAEIDVLRAPGISRVDSLPFGLEVSQEVAMDEIAVVVVPRGSKAALGTHGVATCYAVCARGRNASGEMVLSLGHHSDLHEANSVIGGHEAVMRKQGVKSFELYILGGEVSTFSSALAPQAIRGGSLDFGLELLIEGGDRVAAARIGLSETRDDDSESYEHFVKGPSTGRPASVSVVISSQGIFHAPCNDGVDLF